MKKLLVTTCFIALALVSCKKDNCDDCNFENLQLNFYPMVGSSPLVYNQEYIVNGRKLKFTRAQFYVSGISLKKEDNTTVAPAMPYALVHSQTIEYNQGEINPVHYTGLEFSIGVDSAANHGDPAQWSTTHPLYVNSPYATYWTWSSGYVFIRLEGYVDDSPGADSDADAGFVYHIGNDDLLRNVSLVIDQNLCENGTIELNADYAKMLESVDFTTELETHTTNNKPLAEKIADKTVEAFSVR